MPGYKTTQFNPHKRLSPHTYRTDTLSPEQRVTIARTYLRGVATAEDLAREFDVSEGHICKIARQYTRGTLR
jgi:transposase-like protein